MKILLFSSAFFLLTSIIDGQNLDININQQCEFPNFLIWDYDIVYKDTYNIDLSLFDYNTFFDSILEFDNKLLLDSAKYSMKLNDSLYVFHKIIGNNSFNIFINSKKFVYRFINYNSLYCIYKEISIKSDDEFITYFNCNYNIPNNCYEEVFKNNKLIEKSNYIPKMFCTDEQINNKNDLNIFLKNAYKVNFKLSDGKGGFYEYFYK